MDEDGGGAPIAHEDVMDTLGIRRRLRSYRERVEESESSERESAVVNSVLSAQHTHPRSSHARQESTLRSTATNTTDTNNPRNTGQLNTLANITNTSVGRGSRRSFNPRHRRRGGSNSGLNTSPSEASGRRESTGNEGELGTRPHAVIWNDLGSNRGDMTRDDELAALNSHTSSNLGTSEHSWFTTSSMAAQSTSAADQLLQIDFAQQRVWDDEDSDSLPEIEHQVNSRTWRIGPRSHTSVDDLNLSHIRFAGKRSRDKYENPESRDAMATLTNRGAVAVILYHSEFPDPEANDVWPNFRNAAKLPARYHLLGRLLCRTEQSCLRSLQTLLRPGKHVKKRKSRWDDHLEVTNAAPSLTFSGWPAGQLPTELFEEIAGYLNRDDIKSMRLVCREFDGHVSQVLFKTVVVPFNTEIYGMLGQEKPDRKGKKKVRVENKSLLWKNGNGDDVYNGHGLDVFKGFGQHILNFGMSFEVNEDSLSKPPEKSLTEKYTSFWGVYQWPFEEYRRFDDVAGLESAADETPRMTVAFSELKKVRELALSIDSGLGWLNGPDRSMRARILQRPPEVFGTLKNIPDRRAQAQKELWDHVESCHRHANSDVKLATLYKMDIRRDLTDLQGAPSLLSNQPEMPFLDSHLIHEAVPSETADIQIPTSFDDPEVLDRFVMVPSASGAGILFTSSIMPTDAGQLVNPIIPANLTKAQKEWLLETEWAQRAFISSYMLSIIDNSATFSHVHTLNISQLSDRYVLMLNRRDFWDALPSLSKVLLLVIPGWRNVYKDEAGFVETPKISPTTGVDFFYDLLKNILSQRENITDLTIGWACGGEHAEGVHARNKLLLPAPLLSADSATEQDPEELHEQLLEFPHVEDLTLKNCWLTPAALTQFVLRHDKLGLKNLALNSVSLTSVLRNPGNGQNVNHAQQAGGFVMAAGAAAAIAVVQGLVQGAGHGQQVGQVQQNPINPQQFLQFHIQALQMQIQQMQAQGGAQGQPQQLAQLQAQLQNQLQLHNQMQPLNAAQQMQQIQQHHQNQNNQNNPPQQIFAAPPAGGNAQPARDPQSVLRTQPRNGSWLHTLDVISPGFSLKDFGSEHSQADPERSTSLERIRLVSCGYAKLPYAQFDQNAIEPLHSMGRNPVFTKKFNALAPAMLSAKWPLLGEIVQEVDPDEFAALKAGFDLETGWQDAEEAQGPEFDGLLPGGTGRISGEVGKKPFTL